MIFPPELPKSYISYLVTCLVPTSGPGVLLRAFTQSEQGAGGGGVSVPPCARREWICGTALWSWLFTGMVPVGSCNLQSVSLSPAFIPLLP